MLVVEQNSTEGRRLPLREQVKQVLRPLRPYLPSFAPAPSWRRGLAALARNGQTPRTVFDIGVGFGTFDLYRAFPHAYYYLVDPTRESVAPMERLLRHLKGEIHNCALGDRDGEALMEIRADIQGSTFFEECGERDVLRHESVPMRRFDTVFGEIARPALAKIDVQGAELMVLEGMGTRLSELDAVIIETSILATIKGGPELQDIVAYLHARGFVVFDVLGMKRRPLDGAAAQLDLLFVPEASTLRADRRWAGL